MSLSDPARLETAGSHKGCGRVQNMIATDSNRLQAAFADHATDTKPDVKGIARP